MICENTNIHGWLKVTDKSTYSSPDGGWPETSPDEMYRFIGLIVYMGFVHVPSISGQHLPCIMDCGPGSLCVGTDLKHC